MACVGSSYTFQSSGTVAGNAQNSVVMAPISNGSILLTYKQDGTTVYTRFLKVTALILALNSQTRTLSWTDVGAASQDLSIQEGETLIEIIAVDDTAQTVPASPFVDRSYTVTCNLYGESLPPSNRISVPALIPQVVFQTTQVFQLEFISATILAGTQDLPDLLTQLNTDLRIPDLFTFNGTSVVLNGNPYVLIPVGQYTTETVLILQRLGFVMLGELSQLPVNEIIDRSVTALIPMQLIYGNIPTAPTQPTNLAVTDITQTTATLTVDITNQQDVFGVAVVVQNGTQWEGTGAVVIQPESNSVTIALADLTPNTEQTYAIQTNTSFDLSPVSQPVTFTTSGGPPLPPAPFILGLVTTTARTPTLRWGQDIIQGDPIPDSQTVKVYQNGELTITKSGIVPNFGTETVTFFADEIALNVAYEQRVVAVQSGIEGTPSDPLQQTILSSDLLGSKLTSSNITPYSIDLSLDDALNDSSGLGTTTQSITISPVNQQGRDTFTGLSSTTTLTDLAPGTTYTINLTGHFTSGGVPFSTPTTPQSRTTQTESLTLVSEAGVIQQIFLNGGIGYANKINIICTGDGSFSMTGTTNTSGKYIHMEYSIQGTGSDAQFDGAIPNTETPGTFMEGDVRVNPVIGDPLILATTPVNLDLLPQPTVYTPQLLNESTFNLTGSIRKILGVVPEGNYENYCMSFWLTDTA